jgi:SOS-response transcriptional repressor LexA
MSWADWAIKALEAGNSTQIRPRGNSMKGRIESGNLVTLSPCQTESLEVGDIVLVRVHGNVYLHLVKAKDGGRFLIGNNRGGTNGWVGPAAIYGKAVRIEP